MTQPIFTTEDLIPPHILAQSARYEAMIYRDMHSVQLERIARDGRGILHQPDVEFQTNTGVRLVLIDGDVL